MPHAATVLVSIFPPALSSRSKFTPTDAPVCFSIPIWNGSSPLRLVDQPRRRASTQRPYSISSNAHSLSRMSLTSKLFTPLPNAGRRCARATRLGSTPFAWMHRRSRRPERTRSNCARWRTNLPPPIAPDPASRVLAKLAEAEAGAWHAWWQLTYDLMLTPKSRALYFELNYFITTMPGWGEADETLRRRIVATAERYLADAQTTTDAWLGREPMPLQCNDIAGFRAFILLKQVSPEGYARIADATWRKWAPVIVGLPRRTVTSNSPEIAQILTDALDRAPAEFVGAVRTIIRLERERMRAPGAAPPVGSPFFILNDLDGCWRNDLLRDAISDELRNPDNTPAEYASFLDALLEAGVESALDHALVFLAESSRPRVPAILPLPKCCCAKRPSVHGRC